MGGHNAPHNYRLAATHTATGMENGQLLYRLEWWNSGRQWMINSLRQTPDNSTGVSAI